MSEWLYDYRIRRDSVTIPTIWVAFGLSVLIHILVLGKWLPQVRLPSLEEILKTESQGPLVVNLAPPSSPPPAPPPSRSVEARSEPAHRAARPKAQPHPRSAPPALALNQPRPEAPPPRPEITPPAPAPAPRQPAPAGDLSSYIEARRRARGEPEQPAQPAPAPVASPMEDEDARSKRAVAANLGLNQKPSFGPEPVGGGIFQLKLVGYDYAEFYFYGWSKDIRRNTVQLIEVRKGDNPDIRIAVVRRMIAIIREHEQQDFLWESPRLGRNIMLSARQRDNAGLEDFMMQEFFRDTRPMR